MSVCPSVRKSMILLNLHYINVFGCSTWKVEESRPHLFFNFGPGSSIFSVFLQLSQFFLNFLSFSSTFSFFPWLSQFFLNFINFSSSSNSLIFSSTFSVFLQPSQYFGPKLFDQKLTWPILFQTARTQRPAHLPSFCELVWSLNQLPLLDVFDC